MNSIVIPIYKSEPSHLEDISFTQCLKILNRYHINIVTFPELNIDYYINKLDSYRCSYSMQYFDSIYFKSIVGYNFLMLSSDFYRRFKKYEYILIYQLDCFVFEDNLEHWASKNFDYIGSPWFSHYKDYAEDNPFWYNGNGGLSLRRVSSFLKVLNWKFPLMKSPDIVQRLELNNISGFKYYFLYCLYMLGYHNNVSFFLKEKGYDQKILKTAESDGFNRSNEDVLWSGHFMYTRVKIKTPNFEEGLGFSFERSPSYLFEQNGHKLPFACHAWQKYEFDFWKPHIEKFGYIV